MQCRDLSTYIALMHLHQSLEPSMPTFPTEFAPQTILDGNGFQRHGWACAACEGTGRVQIEHRLPLDQRCEECAGDGWFDASEEGGEE